MAERPQAGTIDEYIAEFPPDVQVVLEEMRALIRANAPDATETIAYSIPTFDQNGKHVVHFAAFKAHVSFYPTGSGVAAFQDELDTLPYKLSKGTIQIPLGEPLPKDLIRRIVAFRVAAVGARTTK